MRGKRAVGAQITRGRWPFVDRKLEAVYLGLGSRFYLFHL